jgi:hypothetical protein
VISCIKHAYSLRSRSFGFNRQKTNDQEIGSIFSLKRTLTHRVPFNQETLVAGAVLEPQKVSLSSNCRSDGSCSLGCKVTTTQILRPPNFVDRPKCSEANNLLAAIFQNSTQCNIFRKSASLYSTQNGKKIQKLNLKSRVFGLEF